MECSTLKLILRSLPFHRVKTRMCGTKDKEGRLCWVVYGIPCHPHIQLLEKPGCHHVKGEL